MVHTSASSSLYERQKFSTLALIKLWLIITFLFLTICKHVCLSPKLSNLLIRDVNEINYLATIIQLLN